MLATVLTGIALFAIAAHGEVMAWLFATDGNNNLIRQYDLEGNEIAQITNSSLQFPTFLTADSATRTLITDINFIPGEDGPDLVRLDLPRALLSMPTAAASINSRLATAPGAIMANTLAQWPIMRQSLSALA